MRDLSNAPSGVSGSLSSRAWQRSTTHPLLFWLDYYRSIDDVKSLFLWQTLVPFGTILRKKMHQRRDLAQLPRRQKVHALVPSPFSTCPHTNLSFIALIFSFRETGRRINSKKSLCFANVLDLLTYNMQCLVYHLFTFCAFIVRLFFVFQLRNNLAISITVSPTRQFVVGYT